jgi:hypothetical protein
MMQTRGFVSNFSLNFIESSVHQNKGKYLVLVFLAFHISSNALGSYQGKLKRISFLVIGVAFLKYLFFINGIRLATNEIIHK